METLKGKINIPDNFYTAFADEIADMFEYQSEIFIEHTISIIHSIIHSKSYQLYKNFCHSS